MFPLILISLLVVNQVLASPEDDVKTVLTKCNNGDAPTDDIVKMFMNPMITEDDQKCLFNCAAKEMGVIQEGKFNVDKAKALLEIFHPDEPELLKKSDDILGHCDKEVKPVEDECEFVYELVVCIKEERDKILRKDK